MLIRYTKEDTDTITDERLGLNETKDVTPVLPSRKRPQRVNQKKRFILSDSKTEGDVNAGDDFSTDEHSSKSLAVG